MSKNPHELAPELALRIRTVELQIRRRQWSRCWARLAVATLILTAAFTGLLAISGAMGVPRGGAIGLYIVAELLAIWILLYRPTSKPIPARQVALLIDQCHPELENRILSAVEFSSPEFKGPSAWMIERFLEETREQARRIKFSEMVDMRRTTRVFSAASLLWIFSAVIVLVFHALWIPSLRLGGAPAARPKAAPGFTVEPGNVRVRVGDNQVVLVKSMESGPKVSIEWRRPEGLWQTESMGQGSSSAVHYHQFTGVSEDLDYRVQFGRRESEIFRITAWTPPEVREIDLTYHYPDYLGLPPREIPNGGNITAVEGTDVDLAVQVNKKLRSAEMVLASGKKIPLERDLDSVWVGRIKVAEGDKYHIELLDEQNSASEFNPEYSITAQRDKPPVVKVEFPRGDSEVTSLEEVPLDFRVSDDFGLAGFGIQYEVVGKKEPVRIALDEKDLGGEEVKGHHEIMLENLGLTPGDLITWTVWAKDRKPGRPAVEELGDPYFLEVRPFRRDYSEAISNQSGGMQGGGMQGNAEAASEKDILIATWNLRRKAPSLKEKEFNDQKTTILGAQVDLLKKIQSGQGAAGAAAKLEDILDPMTAAAQALKEASLPDPSAALSEATLQEEKAYRAILKRNPTKAMVQQMRGAGGGGGGGNQAELNELELDRNKNFYEEENRTQGEQQKAAEQTLSKIKELAQRQKMVNEEIAKLISELNMAKDEEERRELKRRLERLREEEQKAMERLDEIQRDVASGEMDPRQARQTQDALNDARQEMNKGLQNLRDEQLQQARSAGSRAVSSLDEIQEKLQSLSRQAAAQKMKELQEKMAGLRKQEGSVMDKITSAKEDTGKPGLTPAGAADDPKKEILDAKEGVSKEFVKTMEEASELADRAGQSQELMSRKLGDWLRQTTKDGILEDMEKGKQLVNYGIWDSAMQQERAVDKKLAQAAQNLDNVARQMVADDLEGMQRALDQLKELLSNQGDPKQVADAGANPQKDGKEGTSPKDESSAEAKSGRGKDQKEAGQNQDGRGEKGKEGRGEDGQKGQDPSGRDGKQGQGQESADGKNPQPGTSGERASQGGQPGRDQQQGGRQGGQGGGQRPDRAADSSPQSGQRPQGGSPNRDAAAGGPSDPRGGGGGPNWGGWAFPTDMRRFVESDYQRWLENIRSAEALLPADSPYRRDLERARGRIEEMRRDFRRHSLAPHFDLFLQAVGNPIAETAGSLERAIQKLLKEKEFVLTDDGSIPSNYRKPVAEYFKSLADSEKPR